MFFIGGLFGNILYYAVSYFTRGKENPPAPPAASGGLSCPSCGGTMGIPGLVPVIGYFFFLGRCRRCRGRLPVGLPALQAFSGMALPGVFHAFGFNIYAASIFLIISLAISITVIDMKTFTIPDPLVILFFVISIYPVLFSGSLKESLFGLLLFFLFFIVIMFIFPGSFGGGDLKYASVMGFFLGLEYSIVALEIALISGAVTGIVLAFVTGKSLKSRMPFGPFLTLGLICALFYGREIVLYYLKMFF